MFAFQHSNPYTFPFGQPVQSSSPSFYPRQPSKVELLRAQLAQAEQEAALARQRRFDDILEEERLRALARRQVEEEEKEARIRKAIVLQQQEQARQRVIQQQIEEQKRIRLARAFQEERLRLYRAEQRKLLEQIFGDNQLVEEPKAAPHYTGGAPLKRKQAIRKQSVDIKEPQPKTQESSKKPDDAHTIVIDLADIFGLLSEHRKESTPRSQSNKPEPTAATSSAAQATTSASSQAPAIKRSPSVESRPDLLTAQTIAAPVEASEQQKDITGSLSAIEAIASGFDKLVSEFSFPSTLDFTPPSSRNASRTSNSASDDEGDSTSISKLAYTPNNAPLRVFENAASKMLNLLDAVDSFGDAELRKARKGVVERVEGKLEEVEREVSRRWRGWSEAKEIAVPSEEKPVEVAVAEPQPEESAPPELPSSPAVEAQEPSPLKTETTVESDLVTVDAGIEVVSAVESSSASDEAAVQDANPLDTSGDATDSAVLAESVADLLTQPATASSAADPDTDSESESEAFLLSLPQDDEPQTRRRSDEEKAEDSDWSEVEA
ncbi:hypothetical protein DL96DRAFT_1491479 [Flagelloscypha sp. PMI_526]|nr:hypothetical protein DL96DRAFT_1491479 [Flagelloscypha sp. PMI_526]